MIKKDVIDLNLAFTALKELGSPKFKYAMMKNSYLLKGQLDALIEVEKTINETIAAFTEARNAIIVELGTKDDKGNVFVDPKDAEVMKSFNERLAVLIEEHKAPLDEYNKKIADFEEIIKEPVEDIITFRQVSIDQVPEEGVAVKDLDLLVKFDIIGD